MASFISRCGSALLRQIVVRSKNSCYSFEREATDIRIASMAKFSRELISEDLRISRIIPSRGFIIKNLFETNMQIRTYVKKTRPPVSPDVPPGISEWPSDRSLTRGTVTEGQVHALVDYLEHSQNDIGSFNPEFNQRRSGSRGSSLVTGEDAGISRAPKGLRLDYQGVAGDSRNYAMFAIQWGTSTAAQVHVRLGSTYRWEALLEAFIDSLNNGVIMQINP